jgi:ribosomal protein S18 acetylase RimI-like enzyme
VAYTFRRAEPDDADALRTFPCADRGLQYTRDVEQLVRSDLADEVAAGSGDTQVDIATDDAGAIVGVIAYGLVPLDSAVDVDGALFIYALAVHPDHRRRLVGTLLKQLVFDAARDRQLIAVVSQVHRRNTPMRQLNATLGVVAAPDPTDGEYLISVARVT